MVPVALRFLIVFIFAVLFAALETLIVLRLAVAFFGSADSDLIDAER